MRQRPEKGIKTAVIKRPSIAQALCSAATRPMPTGKIRLPEPKNIANMARPVVKKFARNIRFSISIRELQKQKNRLVAGLFKGICCAFFKKLSPNRQIKDRHNNDHNFSKDSFHGVSLDDEKLCVKAVSRITTYETGKHLF